MGTGNPLIMLKILTSNQIRHLDQYTIKKEPITSIDLMERAAFAFTEWFMDKFPHGLQVHVFSGVGNNGGDAMAIARMLLLRRYSVRVNVIGKIEKGTEDFQRNYHRLDDQLEINHFVDKRDFYSIGENSVIIDGLFGSGLNRILEGFYEEVINYMNYQKAPRVSIDIASGLFADKNTPSEAIVKADYTVAFQVPKIAFMLPQSTDYVGEWEIVDIGLSQKFIDGLDTRYNLIEPDDLDEVFQPRKKFIHKGEAGKVLLIAGSTGKTGAAILAARAILRSGAGLLTIHAPQESLIALQTAVPEAMVDLDAHNDYFSFPPKLKEYTSIGIGPGINANKVTSKAFDELLKQCKNPIIIDADALNILADHSRLMSQVPPGSILTPHPGEFRRLVGKWENDFEKMEKQIEFSKKYSVNVVVKGAHSCITNTKGEVFFNNTGNPGMATAGSGDVLTGILSGILGQGIDAETTLKTGVYLHGLAGDLALKKKGEISLISSDIVDHLPEAFAIITGKTL